MSEAPFINFYTSDFLGGTSGMTAATKGVYITLLCLIYEGEAPLGQSWDTLARRCGCTLPAFRKAVQTLKDDGKIEVNDGRIWSQKCEKHLTLRAERRNSAKAAAKKRWQKSEQKQSKADETASNPQCKPEPEPDKTLETDVSSVPRKRKTRMREDAAISDAMRRAAEKRGHSQQEAEAQFAKFQNDALAKGKTFVDWDRAFVTWLDSPYFKPITTGGQNGRRSKDGEAAERARRAGERWAARAMDFGQGGDASGALFHPRLVSGGGRAGD